MWWKEKKKKKKECRCFITSVNAWILWKVEDTLKRRVQLIVPFYVA